MQITETFYPGGESRPAQESPTLKTVYSTYFSSEPEYSKQALFFRSAFFELFCSQFTIQSSSQCSDPTPKSHAQWQLNRKRSLLI